MNLYSWNKNISDFGPNSGIWGSGLTSKSQSLVLDEEKGELVKAQGRVGKKDGLSEGKAMAALKSHSEAERRRRERINAHIDVLRGLVLCTEKMEKATVLAEVIRQVKQLKNTATQASKGLLIPEDADEVKVEQLDETADDGSSTFRASLCCDYRPALFSDLKRALDALNISIARAEMSTLGGRVKSVFYFSGSADNGKARELLVSSVREALNSVAEKVSISPEYSPRTTLPNKRRRFSVFDNSSSSS